MLKVNTFHKIFPIIPLIVLPLILFGNTLFPPEGKMLYGGDIYDAYYFWKGFLRQSFLAGTIPFWNPYNFSGTPFLAHPNINIFYPPNWLFIVLPQEYSFVYYLYLHVVIAGIAMYWLVRQFSDQLGAITSGILYALGGFFAARIFAGHPEYIDTAAWVPVTFGLGRLALINSSWRYTVRVVFGFAILLLVGNELFFLFTLEMLGLYTIYRVVSAIRERRVIRVIGGAGKVFFVAVPFAFAATAIEVLPRVEFLRNSLRSVGVPYGVAASASLPLAYLRLFIEPFLFGGPTNYSGVWPNLAEYTYYLGIVPIILLVGFLLF